MKKLIILLSIFVVFMLAWPAEAQKVRQLADVQVDAAETIVSETITVSGGYASLSVDILCTEDGGTSDGSIVFQGRNGASGNWTTINDDWLSTQVEFLTNDTLTIVDAAVWKVSVVPATFKEYRFSVTGTASDTTTVTFYYIIKYH